MCTMSTMVSPMGLMSTMNTMVNTISVADMTNLGTGYQCAQPNAAVAASLCY